MDAAALSEGPPLLARGHAAWRTGLARTAVSRLFTTKARPPSQTADDARVESFSEGFDRGNAAYLGRTSDRDDDGKIVIPWVTVATTAAVLGGLRLLTAEIALRAMFGGLPLLQCLAACNC